MDLAMDSMQETKPVQEPVTRCRTEISAEESAEQSKVAQMHKGLRVWAIMSSAIGGNVDCCWRHPRSRLGAGDDRGRDLGTAGQTPRDSCEFCGRSSRVPLGSCHPRALCTGRMQRRERR
jgi:hypothetical protein